MYAAFMSDGTTPCCRDQFNRWHRNGARRITLCFSSHVGRASEKHCLSGSARTISITSVDVTGAKRRSSQPAATAVNCGWATPAAPAVADALDLTMIILSLTTEAIFYLLTYLLTRKASNSKQTRSVPESYVQDRTETAQP